MEWRSLQGGGLAPISAHKEHAARAVHYENALRDGGLFQGSVKPGGSGRYQLSSAEDLWQMQSMSSIVSGIS